MSCRSGPPSARRCRPGSRNGGPIPPFPQEKLSEDAALAGSDSNNGRVGSSQTVRLSRSISAESPLSDPPASAASEFFSQGKRDRSPREGGPINRMPVCSTITPPP
jgi:hypothetical protein